MGASGKHPGGVPFTPEQMERCVRYARKARSEALSSGLAKLAALGRNAVARILPDFRPDPGAHRRTGVRHGVGLALQRLTCRSERRHG